MNCRHLSRRHEQKYREYQSHMKQPSSAFAQPAITDFTRSPASACRGTPSSSSNCMYNNNSSRQKLITQSIVHNLIIGCGMPVSIVDNEYFRTFLADIDPKYVPPCRQSVTTSLIPKLVADRKEAVQKELDECSAVALTTDIWTDQRQHSYMVVTSHSLVARW